MEICEWIEMKIDNLLEDDLIDESDLILLLTNYSQSYHMLVDSSKILANKIAMHIHKIGIFNGNPNKMIAYFRLISMWNSDLAKSYFEKNYQLFDLIFSLKFPNSISEPIFIPNSSLPQKITNPLIYSSDINLLHQAISFLILKANTIDISQFIKTYEKKLSNLYRNVLKFERSPFEDTIIKAINSICHNDVKISQINQIGPFNVDILFDESKLIIECDGLIHYSKGFYKYSEILRKEYLESKGYNFVSIKTKDWWNFDDSQKLEILTKILNDHKIKLK